MLLRFLNIVFCLFWFNANSQDLDWVKPVTNDSFSNIGKVRITPDGDLLTLVNSYYYNRNDTLNHYRSTTTLEKFNSSGEKIWQLPINSSYKYSISDFETDSVGNIFLIGYFEKELHVDHVTEYTDSNAFFVAKFNSENEIIWFRKAFGLYFSTISLMPQGKVIISSFTSEIGVDLEKSDNVSDLAHYETEYRQGRGLTAYNAYDGNLLWSKFYGWDDKNSYAGVYKTQATRNGIYELVRWEGKIDVETGPGKTILETVDPSFILMNSFYISKYSPDGDLLWCKILERDSSSYFGEIENVYMDADNVGNIFLTGGFHGKVDFDFTGKEYTIIVKGRRMGLIATIFLGNMMKI